MNIRTPKDLNNLIRDKKGLTEEIRLVVQDAVTQHPVSMFTVPAVIRYLNAEMQRSLATQVMTWKEPNWLRYVPQMREFLQDEEIRPAALAIYEQSPWFFYNHSEGLKQIFPNEWFKKLISEEGLDLKNSPLWNMFLLFNWHSLPESFGSPVDKFIDEAITGMSQENVSLLWIKEPGFACGGMEKNFLEAAKSGQGICVVNDTFYAKFYHRKWDPAKVTYLPKKDFRTNNWYVVWPDYFYSPSNGQHWATIEAIKAGTKHITIPDLVVKAVRPTIGLKSEQINAIIRQ